MNSGDISGALQGALAARPEIADRADRCRAALNDILGHAATDRRREVGLVVAAVEERVPEALRSATTQADIDAIASRFRNDRALEPAAARWTVDLWSDALRSVGVTSIPIDELSERNVGRDSRADAATIAPGLATTGASGPRPPARTLSETGDTRSAKPSQQDRTLWTRGRAVAIIAVVGLIALGGVAYSLTGDHGNSGKGTDGSGAMPMTGTVATGAYPNAAEAILLKHVPQATQTCERSPNQTMFVKAIAVVQCSGHLNGTVDYASFASAADLREHFGHLKEIVGPRTGGSCLDFAGIKARFYPSMVQTLPAVAHVRPGTALAQAGPGELMCSQQDGHLNLIWTNERVNILVDATENDLNSIDMAQWWQHFGGPCVSTCAASA